MADVRLAVVIAARGSALNGGGRDKMFDPRGRADDTLPESIGSFSRYLAALSIACVLAALSLPASGQAGELQLWSYDVAGAQMLFAGGNAGDADRPYAQSGTLVPGTYGFFLNISRQTG